MFTPQNRFLAVYKFLRPWFSLLHKLAPSWHSARLSIDVVKLFWHRCSWTIIIFPSSKNRQHSWAVRGFRVLYEFWPLNAIVAQPSKKMSVQFSYTVWRSPRTFNGFRLLNYKKKKKESIFTLGLASSKCTTAVLAVTTTRHDNRVVGFSFNYTAWRIVLAL